MDLLAAYREIWLVDFEFESRPGECPIPVCVVAYEWRTNRLVRLWRDQLIERPPYSTGPDSLFVAYLASAEIGCHLALSWPVPQRVLDLYAEFRCLTNGLDPLAGNSLLGALTYHGLDGIGAEEKAEMIDRILRGPPWREDERCAILDYCQSDVEALGRLLAVMLPRIDLPRALLRGRYMTAVARMERVGVPIDVALFYRLKDGWLPIQDRLIQTVDAQYGVYEGTTFKLDRFTKWLVTHKIPWPVLPSGQLDLGERTFRDMALSYPALENLRQLRHSLSKLRLNSITVGRDGYNRCMLSPFKAKTSRNQPSNSRSIFGPSAWLRGLIKPSEGWAAAYLDWEGQEHGIGAGLSRDQRMRAAYETGDPYLAFAVSAGAAPLDATKETHETVRTQYKITDLSTMYGIETVALAVRLGIHPLEAKILLDSHHGIYNRFWAWSDNALNHCLLHGWQDTVFGWRRYLGSGEINPRSLRNFWIQGNGAEMLRLAACLGTEAGISVGAPVHDAFLIVAPLERIEEDAARMAALMREAARVVLDGFELRVETKIIRSPERYMDKRGVQMWATVMGLLDSL
jgi:hypothetical protein